ncbi:MAG TPA: hypothetical protein VKW08_00445 [Xanthobacteraceae bacterium]|jgi:hypothetical protein|nr:hypothetical protein [Xanthobacteraceae bacterium]
MKAVIRIPTEQYAFIEIETEVTSSEEALNEYRALKKLYQVGSGLAPKDWNRVLDRYLWGDGSMHSEEYAAMNENQQTIIQEIKRSKKRQ